jgi:hypothetical protein
MVRELLREGELQGVPVCGILWSIEQIQARERGASGLSP